MKTHSILKKYPLNLLFILLVIMASSCIEMNPKTEENSSNSELTSQNTTKEIKEVILLDNGPVVQRPMTRRVVWSLVDSENITLSYTEQNGDEKSVTKNKIAINNDVQEEMRDEIDKIAELAEDGIALKPGKQPCMGMNSLDISVIYNTGDTSHFNISGNIRCDPSLYPSVWTLDSLGTEMYRTSKGKTQK